MKSRKNKDSLLTEERLCEAAREDQRIADALLIRDAALDPHRTMAAHILVASYRALQMITAKGIPFERLTPEMLVAFVRNERAAVEQFAHVDAGCAARLNHGVMPGKSDVRGPQGDR